MAINLSFAGASIRRPGAYSTVVTDGMAPSTISPSNVLAIVGTMEPEATLAPKTALYFNDPTLAREALKQGYFMEVAEAAWAHGADLIALIRVDDATQATGAIGDVFDVKAKVYGTTGNEIAYEVEGASITLTRGGQLERFEQREGETNAAFAARIGKQSRLATLTAKSEDVYSEPVEPTNLTGGTGGGVVTDDDWQRAINTLNTEDVQGIIVATTEGAIQLKLDAHVNAMSTVKNKKERRAFYGHETYATLDDIAMQKAELSNERVVIATPAPKIMGAGGVLQDRDSVLTAAAYAGMWSSKDPQDPITYDYLKFPGLVKHYSAEEIEQLLRLGVAPTEFVNGRGFRIVQGLTTYDGEDLSKAELSVSTLKDVMSRQMREMLEEKHVGKAGIAGIEVTIFNDAMTLIDRFLKSGYISEYIEGSLKVVKDATTFTVNWEGKPTLPINNFLITAHFTL